MPSIKEINKMGMSEAFKEALSPVSREFEDAFKDGHGGCRRTCECGRIFYNSTGGWDFEPGELEELKEHPLAEDVEWTVETLTILGKEYVLGCHKCMDKIRQYEQFIWAYRDPIAKYLSVRVMKIKKGLEETLKNLKESEVENESPNTV